MRATRNGARRAKLRDSNDNLPWSAHLRGGRAQDTAVRPPRRATGPKRRTVASASLDTGEAMNQEPGEDTERLILLSAVCTTSSKGSASSSTNPMQRRPFIHQSANRCASRGLFHLFQDSPASAPSSGRVPLAGESSSLARRAVQRGGAEAYSGAGWSPRREGCPSPTHMASWRYSSPASDWLLPKLPSQLRDALSRVLGVGGG